MPKFKVRPGYAFHFPSSNKYAEEGAVIELEHIDVGLQGWKLEPTEEDVETQGDDEDQSQDQNQGEDENQGEGEGQAEGAISAGEEVIVETDKGNVEAVVTSVDEKGVVELEAKPAKGKASK